MFSTTILEGNLFQKEALVLIQVVQHESLSCFQGNSWCSKVIAYIKASGSNLSLV